MNDVRVKAEKVENVYVASSNRDDIVFKSSDILEAINTIYDHVELINNQQKVDNKLAS